MLLKYIGGQDYPKELYEVIVVDDDPTDKTYKIVPDFTGNEKYIVINNKGKGRNRPSEPELMHHQAT